MGSDLSYIDDVRGDREIEYSAHCDDCAMRQAQGLLVLDVELFIGQVGRPGVFHFAEDEADVEEGLLESSAGDYQDHRHDAADQRRDRRRFRTNAPSPTRAPMAAISLTSPAPMARRA